MMLRAYSFGSRHAPVKTAALGRGVNMLSRLQTFHKDESGQDLIEYALVVALIAFAAIAGMNFVASEINVAFSKIGNKLTSAIS
jgi:pilus assembly protein Flp/PilA